MTAGDRAAIRDLYNIAATARAPKPGDDPQPASKRRFMELPSAGPGKWWVNVAPLGEMPVWEVQVQPLPENDRLFGYEPREFLAKQYRDRGRA